jgi:hypothetical protein
MRAALAVQARLRELLPQLSDEHRREVAICLDLLRSGFKARKPRPSRAVRADSGRVVLGLLAVVVVALALLAVILNRTKASDFLCPADGPHGTRPRLLAG